MGGAIFVGNTSVLNITSGSISGNTATGGTGAAAGGSYGPDLFIQSGGTVNFNLTSSMMISTAIQSDLGVGGGTGGGLTLTGTSSSTTLTLGGSNTYTGGTTITSGTLAIGSDQALGASSYGLTIANGTLQAMQPITFPSTRAISLTGLATLNPVGNAISIAGNITGAGSFNIFSSGGAATIMLSGTNTYSGGTNIGPTITLQGTTSSLQGNITFAAASSTLTFNQTTNGIYSGVLSGPGTLNIAGASGTLQISGNSPAFTGPVNVSSGKTFQIDGSLANASLVTIPSGATLTGSGTVGSTTNSGKIIPGSPATQADRGRSTSTACLL
jgi:autotransporter-associated beta strand protein